MRKSMAFLAASGALLAGCNSEPGQIEKAPIVTTTTRLPLVEIGPVALESHEAAAKDWIDQAQKVADITGDERAKEIMELLHRSGVAKPVPGNQIESVKSSKGNAPLSVPLMEGDDKYGDRFAEKMNLEGQAASFVGEINSIFVIDTVPTSDTFKGILGLHEGNHALDYLEDPAGWQIEENRSAIEYSSHVLQNRLMLGVGGEAYEKFIEGYADEIKSTIKSDGEADEAPLPNGYDPKIDDIFGPALSDQEKSLRQTHIWMDAVFRTFDDIYGEGAKDRQLGFLKSVYDYANPAQ